MTRPISQAVADIALRVAQENGVTLYHLELSGSDVRIQIDTPTGVTHEVCTGFSRALALELDARDIFAGDYRLEVSSPGIERRLYRPADFTAAVGRHARVKTRSGTLEGRISTADDTGVEIEVRAAEGTRAVRVEYQSVTAAQVKVTDKELFAPKTSSQTSDGRDRHANAGDRPSCRQDDRQVATENRAAGHRSTE